MDIRQGLFSVCLASLVFGHAVSSRAETLELRKLNGSEERVNFQVVYKHLPLSVSLPGGEALAQGGATMKIGLGEIQYCDEFVSLENSLDQVLGVAKESLSFRVSETLAKVTFGLGEYVFSNDLQVKKEVCNFEGEVYALYYLAGESDFALEVPVTDSLLRELKSLSAGVLEVDYSVSSDFDSGGVVKWDARGIAEYAGEVLQSRQAN